MARYQFRGDKETWESYNKSLAKVTETSQKGREIHDKLQAIDEEIGKGHEAFENADREVMKLKKQLASAEAKRISIENQNVKKRAEKGTISEEKDRIMLQFNEAKADKNRAKEAYLHSIPTAQRKNIAEGEMVGPSSTNLDIHALGDVHG